MRHATARPLRRLSRGLTLVEAVVTLAVLTVLAGLAAPDLGRLVERRELEAAAAQLETDLQLARSEAVSRHATVRLDVQAGAGASCYVLHDGPAGSCDCLADGAPVCRADARVLRSVRLAPGARVALASNSPSMAFDADAGTVTPTGTLRLTGRGGDEIRQVVNIMGRVRSCSPSMNGFKRC